MTSPINYQVAMIEVRNRIRFTTSADVAPQMFGHLDRFRTEGGFHIACLRIWETATHSWNGAAIDRDKADEIVEHVLEEEAAGCLPHHC